MTCIVAIETPEGVWMGGDSAVPSGWNRQILAGEKVFRRISVIWGDIIFGFAGSPRAVRFLPHVSAIHAPRADIWLGEFAEMWRSQLLEAGMVENSNGVQSFDGGLLVGIGDEIYEIDKKFYVSRTLGGYRALGSGEDFALGSLYSTPRLHPRKRILTALKAAAQHNIYVSEPFHVIFNGD